MQLSRDFLLRFPSSLFTSVSSIFASASIYTSVHFNFVDTAEQISSRRNYAEGRIRGEYNLIGKKLTRDVSIKEQSKGRMLARAERCVISQRRTVCRARLVHVAVHYRFYNQGRGSEPRALVSPPAIPSLTPRELISRTSRSWNTLRCTQKFLIAREIFHAAAILQQPFFPR